MSLVDSVLESTGCIICHHGELDTAFASIDAGSRSKLTATLSTNSTSLLSTHADQYVSMNISSFELRVVSLLQDTILVLAIANDHSPRQRHCSHFDMKDYSFWD